MIFWILSDASHINESQPLVSLLISWSFLVTWRERHSTLFFCLQPSIISLSMSSTPKTPCTELLHGLLHSQQHGHCYADSSRMSMVPLMHDFCWWKEPYCMEGGLPTSQGNWNLSLILKIPENIKYAMLWTCDIYITSRSQETKYPEQIPNVTHRK
jgi:hypothetical protein